MVKKGCNLSMSYTTIFLISLLLILLAAVLYLFIIKKPEITENFNTDTDTDSDFNLEFYSMNGCGWCNKFKPAWKELEQKFPNNCQEINESHPERNSKMKLYGVRGFPHIQLIKSDGSVVVYKPGPATPEIKGDRSVEDIEKWIKMHI